MQMNKNFSNLEFRDYTHATENISEIFAYLTITKKQVSLYSRITLKKLPSGRICIEM